MVSFIKDVREFLTPVLQESAFLSEFLIISNFKIFVFVFITLLVFLSSYSGMLTPEEFMGAGDQLVQKYPNWSWLV